MSEKINDGGSAFPIGDQRSQSGDITSYAEFGMSLRDYFAAEALAGWLATYDTQAEHPARDDADPAWADNIARASYRLADAMLRARGAA